MTLDITDREETDSEHTCPSSDVDQVVVKDQPEIASILSKMEQLNRANESDARSVTSKRSDDASSASQTNGSPVHQAKPCQEDDETVDLWTVWGNLVKSWEVEMKKRPKCVKELVRRGVPQHFRTIAWQLLAGADAISIHDQYTEYLRQSSPYEKIIMRDIPRTYPELDFFKDESKGQQHLFNVIKAYSVHDKEVGYCQGSAFIVGQLLLQMPEEETFAVFVKLMENYRLRELYKPAMTELGLCMFQLECLVQEQMPDLYTHFNNMGFDTSMYASSWFLTLFTTTLPLDLTNRIMDLFLVDGIDAIFRIALAILQQSRIELLRLDMEGMLKFFQREIRERYENDHELLFAVASQVTLNAKQMKRLEKEYLTKRTKEQEEAVELRRLRTENRLLRQRIDYLEHESSALADRLVRGQVDLAQQADNCLSISHELHVLRDINTDAHKRLEEAYESIRELSSGKKPAGLVLTETGTQVDDTSMIEHIHQLQQELIETHSRKADLENCTRELKSRVQELESANKRLRESPPDGGVAALQEELIRVKMREAEASLSLKEMRQRIAELENHWVRYQEARSQPAQSPTATTPADPEPQPNSARTRLAKLTAGWISGSSGDQDQPSLKELEEQLMGLRIREAEMNVELQEMSQKVMELETQNHVCSNQLKRQDEELKRVVDERDRLSTAEKQLTNQLKEEQHKSMMADSEMREKKVMQRLKYTEALQNISDLKQHIARLESKTAEKFATAQLRGVPDLDDDSIASNRSGGSIADATSINSEEMSAFLAEVTLRTPHSVATNPDSLLDETDEESLPEERKRSKAKPTREHEDTVDSGLDGVHLSDN